MTATDTRTYHCRANVQLPSSACGREVLSVARRLLRERGELHAALHSGLPRTGRAVIISADNAAKYISAYADYL